MIYVSENKAQLVKGDFHPAQFYKGNKKIAGYKKESFEGNRTVILENCYNDRLHYAKIYGNTIQEGEPSPENPMEMQSVGDLVTEGAHSGKYRIGAAAKGKNLLKAPLEVSSWGKETTSRYSYNLSSMLPINETVTLSFDYTILPTYFYFLTDDESIASGGTNENLRTVFLITDRLVTNKLTFTPKEGKSYYLYSALGANNTSSTAAQTWLDRFTYIQIEYGNEATEYEEYKEPQTFDIYLNEPLRKVGNYEDYIDFENKKVVRNTLSRTFTGKEEWGRQDFRLYFIAESLPTINPSEICCVSNRFKAYSWLQLYTNNSNGNQYIGIARQNYYINITPASVVPSVEEWKAQLSAWNEEGNPLTVAYAGATRDETIELPEMPTFRGTTVYEIDTQVTAKTIGEYKKMEE